MSKSLLTIIYVSAYTVCFINVLSLFYYAVQGDLDTALNFLVWVAIAFLIGDSFQGKVEGLSKSQNNPE